MSASHREKDTHARATASDLAAERLEESLLRFVDTLESKYNFNPEQPRYPRGVPFGGRWRQMPGAGQLDFDPRGFERVLREGSEATDQFLFKHRRTITRVLGGLELFLGSGEGATGLVLAVGGTATSELGVGIPAALAGGWMLYHGWDIGVAGWRALITGVPQTTNLYKLLRGFGLDDQQAETVELTLATSGGLAGAKVGTKILDHAVKRELARRALQPFDQKLALRIDSRGRSLWDEVDIRKRGDSWEQFDAARTGYERTPNAKTFDQIGERGRVAVSNKTIDIQRETYIRRDGRALFSKLRGYIDEVATGSARDPRTGQALNLKERRLHLLLRFGDSAPGQALQVVAAEEYAKKMGVILKVEYAR